MERDEAIETDRVAPQAMRVRLRIASRFAGKYTPDGYQAYEISHRGGLPVLIGYAAKNTRPAQQLNDMPGLTGWQPCNLYLGWEADAGVSDAVLISDLIKNNWLDAITATPSLKAMMAPAGAEPEIFPTIKP